MTKVLLTGGIQRRQYSSLCCYNSEHKSALTISLALAPTSEHYCRTSDCPQPTLQACPTRPGNDHIRRSSALHSDTCSLQSRPSPPAHDMLGCRIPTALVAMCHRTQDAREARLKQSRMSHTIQQTRHLHVANMYCALNQVGRKQHIKWSQVDEAVQSNWFARLLCTACSNHCQHFYYKF